jgi:ABC-type Fe3+-siderophore transport system permease subunit
MKKWILILIFLGLGIFLDLYFFHSFSFFEEIPKEIFWEIRLPRVLVSALVGASLTLAGILIQGFTRNPLSSPSVLGINSFASFFVCLAIAFNSSFVGMGLLIPGFLGTILGALSLYFLAKILQGDIYPERLILAGICQGFLMTSLTNLVVIMDESNTQGLLFWLLGGVDGKNWVDVKILLGTFIPGFLLSILMMKNFDVLILGDNAAKNLGLNPPTLRLIGFLICSILVAGAVVTCGPLSFIGLIVPHVGKKITGDSLRRSLVFSVVLGATFLVYADLLSRTLQFPFETPVGIISGVVGALYFLMLSVRRRVYA